jgi:spermidine synthase
MASGAAALVFETVWFRLTGLMLGNGIWASSVVLAAFMAGLASGNLLAARFAGRWRRPFLAYAACEVAVAVLGFAVVLALGSAGPSVAAALGRWVETPLALNGLRLTVAFALMALPAAAMGATLPALVRGLEGQGESFGALLGRLYGWNTAGAVVGALAGELWLIEPLGLRGAAAVAAVLDVLAALLALGVASLLKATAPDEPAVVAAEPPTGSAPRLLAAAAICGGLLLALEVAWFRFLALVVYPTGATFAILLAVVLAGISLGGMLGGAACSRWAEAPRWTPAVSLGAGALAVAGFWSFEGWSGRFVGEPAGLLQLALRLLFPTCVASGALFVLVGTSLGGAILPAARATSLLTLANTLGAVSGSLLAGLVLLSRVGVDGTVFAMAAGYAVVAALTLPPTGRSRLLVPAAAWGLALVAFPWGLTARTIGVQAGLWMNDGSQIVVVREGLTETTTYLRRDLYGGAHSYRMLTNGVSMSGTSLAHRRYMELFAYLPSVLGGDPRRALLICYGVGNTAAALATLPVQEIDVVDISRDVLALGRLVERPAGHPLDDQRVRAHVEDGRFFLAAGGAPYDLITSEPPPPKQAGVVSLYTREYFALVESRLAEGGMATHWLPVYQLTLEDARATVGAFCAVFEDCTLWSGSGLEWVLAGRRGEATRVAAHDLLWTRPAAALRLDTVGFSGPEQVLATFLADARDLRAFAGTTLPLVDDFPLRLSSVANPPLSPAFVDLGEAEGARDRFARSAWVRDTIPAELRERTLQGWWTQAVYNRALINAPARLEDVERLVAEPGQSTLALVRLASDPLELELAERAASRGSGDPLVPFVRALGAVSRGEWRSAEALLLDAQRRGAPVPDLDSALAFVRRN